MRDEGALLSCSSSLESYQQNKIYSLRLSLLSTLTDSANARQRRISLAHCGTRYWSIDRGELLYHLS